MSNIRTFHSPPSSTIPSSVEVIDAQEVVKSLSKLPEDVVNKILLSSPATAAFASIKSTVKRAEDNVKSTAKGKRGRPKKKVNEEAVQKSKVAAERERLFMRKYFSMKEEVSDAVLKRLHGHVFSFGLMQIASDKVCALFQSLMYSLTHSLTHLSTYVLTHSLMYSLIFYLFLLL